jgi:hypothetical protein
MGMDPAQAIEDLRENGARAQVRRGEVHWQLVT